MKPDPRRRAAWFHFVVLNATIAGSLVGAEPSLSDPTEPWQAAVLEAQAEAAPLIGREPEFSAVAERLSGKLERETPVQWDWCLQDAGPDFRPWLNPETFPELARRATARVLPELG